MGAPEVGKIACVQVSAAIAGAVHLGDPAVLAIEGRAVVFVSSIQIIVEVEGDFGLCRKADGKGHHSQ